jgi:DNA-binding NarL/FixJ family response regulator
LKTRVLIADDHAIVREGLRTMLAAQNDMEVIGSVVDGREALAQTRELLPEVVIMDIAMPKLNGIDATTQICRVLPETKVIILSMHDTAEHVHRAFQAGAKGYLLKESTGWELLDAVRSVRLGRRYLSQGIDARGLDRQGGKSEGSPLQRLSRRELEILQLVVEGRSSVEIGRLISLSPKTVDSYRSRLMQKLAIDDVTGLVKFAIQFGLTELRTPTASI